MSLKNRARYAATMGYSEPVPTDDPCQYCGDSRDVVDGGASAPGVSPDSPRCRHREACYTRRTLRAASDAHFGSAEITRPLCDGCKTVPSAPGMAYCESCLAEIREVRAGKRDAFTWHKAVGGLQSAAFPDFAPKDPDTGRVKPEQLALL